MHEGRLRTPAQGRVEELMQRAPPSATSTSPCPNGVGPSRRGVGRAKQPGGGGGQHFIWCILHQKGGHDKSNRPRGHIQGGPKSSKQAEGNKMGEVVASPPKGKNAADGQRKG